MARKFRSIDDFERHLRNKCGVGEKENYKPWFTVRDVKDNKAFRKEIMGTIIRINMKKKGENKNKNNNENDNKL